jgi:hypothetical protein
VDRRTWNLAEVVGIEEARLPHRSDSAWPSLRRCRVYFFISSFRTAMARMATSSSRAGAERARLSPLWTGADGGCAFVGEVEAARLPHRAASAVPRVDAPCIRTSTATASAPISIGETRGDLGEQLLG